MRRATFNQFRDPREQTPPAAMIKMTNTGSYLFNAEVLASPVSIGRAKRFVSHTVDNTGEPGPAQYTPKTTLLDRVINKGCVKIIKPSLQDEHLYDLVNGTQRVLNQVLMNKTQRRAFDQLIDNTYDYINKNGGRMLRRNLAEGMIYRKALVGKTVTPL